MSVDVLAFQRDMTSFVLPEFKMRVKAETLYLCRSCKPQIRSRDYCIAGGWRCFITLCASISSSGSSG